jgi:hypothetical protein
MLNHVKGCASGLTGPVLTAPAAYELASTQAGYAAVCEELGVLRKSLG